MAGEVSWGKILASHHDAQIAGCDEWEVALEQTIRPALQRGLAVLGDCGEVGEWVGQWVSGSVGLW